MARDPVLSRKLVQWLNEKCNGRWIGRGGSIFGAARSADLTSLGFLLREDINTKAYKTKVNIIAD